tara:strand:- start:31776 stop:33419 length:1644 start_codon:yes stop_codon:yes gene_type:complete
MTTTMMTTSSIENIKLVNKITRNFMFILEKYSDNINTLNHIDYYINNRLDGNIKKIASSNHNDSVIKEREYFINKFLCSTDNIFYYVETNDIFIHYDLNHYKIFEEDSLRSEIYNDIMQNHPNLSNYKFDIESEIINELKKETLFNCIPESSTIQNVINCLMTFFFDIKESAKYFCCVMGDFILKKSVEQVYCVNNEILEFITLFEKTIADRLGDIGLITSNQFVCNKVLDTKLNKHRLIYSQTNSKVTLWTEFLNKYAIDIYAVCIHYSKRYLNSEKYIASNRKKLEKILYLKNNSVKKIIQQFSMRKFKTDTQTSITYENMEYLWYSYLKNECLPADIISHSEFHALMQYERHGDGQITSDNNDDINKNNKSYTSLDHPDNDTITNVKQFLDENLQHSECDQIEISELVEIYIEYVYTNPTLNISYTTDILNEKLMLDMVSYFTSFNIINDGKTIDGISCSLWNKKEELSSFIDMVKTQHNDKTKEIVENISFNEIYTKYCKYISHTGNVNKIVTKSYFINFIIKHIPENYIIFNKISKQYWSSN